jgi:hypothetical protein
MAGCGFAAACMWAALASAWPALARAATESDIRLELSPRICTLAATDKQCETRVSAQWRSPREESLCLVILNRPEVKRCWEKYSEGNYSLELVFAEDLVFQLRDIAAGNILASEVLRVIREAILYRHKRRQPWNIFD